TVYVINWFIGMYKYYKELRSPFLKEQAKYIFMGFLVLFSIGPLAYLPAYGIGIYPFAFISGVLFTVIIAYAIVVHRLMDIKLVMRKWAVYTSSFLSVIIPAFFIEYGLSDLFGIDSFITDIFIIAIAVVFFPFIKNYFFNFANKYLFSSLYDSKRVITELSEHIGSTLELDKIYNLIDETLSNAFHVKAIGVLKFNKKTNEYAVKYDHGFNFGKVKTFKANKKILDSYVLKNKIIVAEELKSAGADFDEVVNMLEKMNVEVLTPLNLKNETIGMIILGPKESGDMYNEEDFSVLKIMSAQVAIAMENALLYEKTKNFNKKLKKEVEVATADLVAANEQLKKLDTAKSEFISIASHQLRTPLTAIKGYISMMLEGDFGQLTQTEIESLQKVFESNERLIRLVENLLNISRIESGRLQFNYADVQLDKMVESVMDELAGHAKKKGLKLEFKKQSSPLPKVHIDEEKIRQVVMNLIDNAVKYTKQGSVTVSLEQTFVGNPEPKPELLFSVSDSGMGIKKEDLPNLFQ
ncbi:MAG: histidine kinase dimerization/phospho-acceptor domain-containing protein, partial [Patescibacteria group bacterium]